LGNSNFEATGEVPAWPRVTPIFEARRDKADVVELINALHLPRELAVDEPVSVLYNETWDALAAER